jgi:phenylacetate-CoA ligase
VNAESVLVEIVDDDGRPCPVWKPGRVVITPLYNTAQPLIRYAQGDVAEWMEPCTCGRHLPRLGGLIGRTTGLFYHPDGRVRAGFLAPNDRAILRCSDWQIAQTGPHDFEVRYIPLDWTETGDEAAMSARIRALYFDDAQVRFSRVRELSSRAGKTIEYVNEWLPPERVQ